MGINTLRRGFTIVELLIVILIIGILATLTIVSYGALQGRANTSAAQNAASQAAKKLQTYFVTNSDTFPSSLATVGIGNTGDTSYQYSVDNTSSPRSYCITVTVKGISYRVSNGGTIPVPGGCAGHVVNGVVWVANHFLNPNFKGPSLPGSTASTTSHQIVDVAGTKYAQSTTTSAGAASMRLSPLEERWEVSEGEQVYVRVKVRNANTTALGFNVAIRFFDSAGANQGALLANISGSSMTIPSGSTVTFTHTATAPAATASAVVTVSRNTTGGPSAVGDLIQATAVWFSDTDAQFASGDSPGWVWNGVPNASVSMGPPL